MTQPIDPKSSGRGMRAFERREAGAYPYYRLARWDDRNCYWKQVRGMGGTEAEAAALAPAPGRYRVTRIERDGSVILEPFTA